MFEAVQNGEEYNQLKSGICAASAITARHFNFERIQFTAQDQAVVEQECTSAVNSLVPKGGAHQSSEGLTNGGRTKLLEAQALCPKTEVMDAEIRCHT